MIDCEQSKTLRGVFVSCLFVKCNTFLFFFYYIIYLKDVKEVWVKRLQLNPKQDSKSDRQGYKEKTKHLLVVDSNGE